MNEELSELRQAQEELNEFFDRLKVLNTNAIKLAESIKSRADDREYVISMRPMLGHSYKEVCKLRDEWKDYCTKWNHLMDEDIRTITNCTTQKIEEFKDIIAKILQLSLRI